MAVASFLSTATTYPHLSSSNSLLPSSSSSLSSSSSSSSSFCLQKSKHYSLVPICKAGETELSLSSPSSSSSSSSSSYKCVSRRKAIALSLSSAFLLSLAGKGGVEAAPLEDEDDLELLEKVKQDRKKRLEKQGIINSSTKEKGYLQDVVYKLSEVGKAIDGNDLSAASSVLGGNTDTDWIKKANSAFTKLSSTPEEKEEVDMFNNSMLKLISSVSQKDVDSSKVAFVSSASAFEKWTELTGINGVLKGL